MQGIERDDNNFPHQNTTIQQGDDFQSNALFDWVDDRPAPKKSKNMVKEQIYQLYVAAVSSRYIGEWDPESQSYYIDERFEGCTNMEVMVMKEIEESLTSNGGSARTRVLDRILGKPKQQVESMNVNANLMDFLEQVAKDQGFIDNSPNVIDVSFRTKDKPFLEPTINRSIIDGI